MSTTVISVRGRDRAELLADPNFVYVGRPCFGWRGSVFANPYTVKAWGDEALVNFTQDLDDALAGRRARARVLPGSKFTVQHDRLFVAKARRLPELIGKVLGCWCGIWKPGYPPIGCHAVVLAQRADGTLGDPTDGAKGQDWPRLSETLTGPNSPVQCQGCGATSVRNLSRWQEHDQADKPEPIVVVLCEACTKKLIEPHPRLYRSLDWNEPFPGTMPICFDCGRRDGVTCTSPLLLRNGGPGLPFPAHDSVAFIDGVRNGRRFGERRKFWSKEVTDCIDKPLIVGVDEMPKEDAGG